MTNPYFTERASPMTPDYEEQYWGKIVDPDGCVRNRLEERIKHLEDVKQELAFLNNLPPGRILDIGCGLGYLLSGLDERWERHGVEISQFAARQAAQWGRIFVGKVQDAQYADAYFDVVVMHHVIEHVADPEAMIQEVFRILRDGGILVLGTPDFDSGAARRFGDKYRLLHDPTHIRLFTNESMHRFLRDYEFVIDRVEYPYFDTRYFTPENLMRLFDVTQISPPFYGSFMTFYCHKPKLGAAARSLQQLSHLANRVSLELEPLIQQASELLANALCGGNLVLACGNGGSAADAQHFVAELVGHMAYERRPLKAITLSSDPSIVTALGNDYGYDQIFARQIEAYGGKGDVLVAISTSGRSPNIITACRAARVRGMHTIGLFGQLGSSESACEIEINVPSTNGQRIQEIHTAILHAFCAQVEEQIVSNESLRAT